MRLLVLSLLAVAAHGHGISYRSNLQAFAPARGEFPVQSELAQGYLRYLDNTGAERLVGFSYPEPLYGIRSEIYTPEQLRASNKLEAQQQHLALFRAWCEQRYNALRIELERLRAEGKQPSANILSQFEPLEQLIKTNAFEPVPGLSPEVQRARDEHLRIWNESRLQVLRAEQAQGGQQPQAVDQRFTPETILLKETAAQPQPQSQAAQTKFSQEQLQIKQTTSKIATQQPFVPLESPKPVQETAEVLRAREEHLKLYNEALQAQPAQPAPAAILKTTANIQPQPQPQLAQLTPQLPQLTAQLPQAPKFASLPVQTPQIPQSPQLAPQPVEETPEVKRAREEHLKQFNAEIQRQQQQQQQQQQQPIAPLPTAKSEAIAPLPAVTIKSSIPSLPAAAPIPSKNIHEQNIQQLTQIKLKAEDKVADYEDRIRYEQREREAELFREKELRREEQKQAELEQEREQLRLIEEQKLLEAERQALQLQEQQRIESERLQEMKHLQAEQQFIFAVDNTPSQPSSSYKLIAPTPVKPQTQPQAQPQPQAIAQQQQVQNGFFLRIQAGQQGAEAIPETIAQNPFLIRYIQQPQQAQVKVLSSAIGSTSSTAATTSTSTSSSSSGSLSSSNVIGSDISELEKATREHFRAHEIALEQLRLANLKNPEASPIPCQHN